jgi:hypothetical protein
MTIDIIMSTHWNITDHGGVLPYYARTVRYYTNLHDHRVLQNLEVTSSFGDYTISGVLRVTKVLRFET